MSRDISTPVNTAVAAAEIQPFFAVDLLFDSPNELYLWSGYGTKTIAGKDYLGAGELLAISSVTETNDISAQGATITISGVPSDLLAKAFNEPYQNRGCNIYFGVVGSEDDYASVFAGYLDTMNITEGPETGTIELSVENRLIDLERARVFRYTDSFQKSQFTGDKGLEFVASLQDQRLPWGKGISD
jgi:hypothetical protein